MDRAWAEGIRWFDTADAYGGGRSEEFIGRWRAARAPEGLVLTTKVFYSTTGTPGDTGLAPDRIRRQVEGSLERLGVERIDLYLAHELDPETRLEETIAAFEALRAEGLIRARGGSRTTTPTVSRRRCSTGTRRSSRTRTRCSSAATRAACCRSVRSTASRTCRSGRCRAAMVTPAVQIPASATSQRGSLIPKAESREYRPGPAAAITVTAARFVSGSSAPPLAVQMGLPQ